MAVESPVSQRLTTTALLLLTFATGLVDSVSVLVLGHVFVANMTGNVIFLGFWLVPHSGVDMLAAVVAIISFVAGAVIGGRLARHLDAKVRRWLVVALGLEVVVLVSLSVLAGTGVLQYTGGGRLDADRRRHRVRQQACRRNRRAGEAAVRRHPRHVQRCGARCDVDAVDRCAGHRPRRNGGRDERGDLRLRTGRQCDLAGRLLGGRRE